MKLEELLPQLHNKMAYFILLDKTTSIPKLCVTKTTNTLMIKMTLSLVDTYIILSLGGQRTTLFGKMIVNLVCDDTQEIIEYKHDYIKFNKNRKYEDWYIAQNKQGLVNAIKMLCKKYNLPLTTTYKYIITTIKKLP